MFDRSFNGASFDAHDDPVRCCRAVFSEIRPPGRTCSLCGKGFSEEIDLSTYCLSNAFDGLAKHIQVIRGIRGLVMSRPVYPARALKIQNLPKHRIGDNQQQPFVFRMAYPCGAHSCSHPDP